MELPTMKVNPWDVDTLDVYLHYCCPECDHKSKTKLLFVNHAFSCHPDAKGLSMSFRQFRIFLDFKVSRYFKG